MAKLGRNQICTCGSGRKYKQCHGSVQECTASGLSPQLIAYQWHLAQQRQRERQQGHGKPIISGQLAGRRIVTVKNRLLHSKGWRTFHDFLLEYIKKAMGRDWGNSEIAKPLAERHPILIWFDHVYRAQQQSFTAGEISTIEATGAVSSYLTLAYDLYTLDHNTELQEKLVRRLRHVDQFLAARYEVFVAAAIIRAGFTLDFEDEDDGSITHCEFTATHTESSRQFSVEAKCRTENGKFRVGRQLCRSLMKHAAYERIVFIELNMPEGLDNASATRELERARAAMRALEGREIQCAPLPSAYVIITNSPAHHHLDALSVSICALGEGFQIADFKQDIQFDCKRRLITVFP